MGQAREGHTFTGDEGLTCSPLGVCANDRPAGDERDAVDPQQDRDEASLWSRLLHRLAHGLCHLCRARSPIPLRRVRLPPPPRKVSLNFESFPPCRLTLSDALTSSLSSATPSRCSSSSPSASRPPSPDSYPCVYSLRPCCSPTSRSPPSAITPSGPRPHSLDPTPSLSPSRFCSSAIGPTEKRFSLLLVTPGWIGRAEAGKLSARWAGWLGSPGMR